MSKAIESEAEGDPSAPEPGESPAPRTAKGATQRSELAKRAQANARRAAESKATVPHIYLSRTAQLAESGADSAPALIAATGRALVSHPALNGAYRDGAVETHGRANIGLTVEGPEGSLVPTVLDADRKSVSEIATEIEELRAGAMGGTLAAPAYSGATFTLTVLAEGADRAALPVVPGQAAHLVAGRVREAVVAGDDGSPRVADVVDLGLSCDARAVGAEEAARFLGTLAALIGPERG